MRSSEATSDGPATTDGLRGGRRTRDVYRITVAASGTAASSADGTWLLVAPDVPLPGVVVLRWLLLVAGAGLIVAWLVQRNVGSVCDRRRASPERRWLRAGQRSRASPVR
ncbi:MAG: hypothetical protein R2699_14450 [Acidimicrobiales bacterium]